MEQVKMERFHTDYLGKYTIGTFRVFCLGPQHTTMCWSHKVPHSAESSLELPVMPAVQVGEDTVFVLQSPI